MKIVRETGSHFDLDVGRYMGERDVWDPRFVEILDDADYGFIRFEPETLVMRDQSYELKRFVRPRHSE